LITFSWD